MEHFDASKETGEDIALDESVKTQKPRMFWVILLNDDYTPMDFVILVLREIFHKSLEEATQLMWDVHKKGQGLCGLYPFSVAQSKAHLVKELSKKHKHPLECILKPADNIN